MTAVVFFGKLWVALNNTQLIWQLGSHEKPVGQTECSKWCPLHSHTHQWYPFKWNNLFYRRDTSHVHDVITTVVRLSAQRDYAHHQHSCETLDQAYRRRAANCSQSQRCRLTETPDETAARQSKQRNRDRQRRWRISVYYMPNIIM